MNIYFIIFEFLIILLFGFCLRHALKSSSLHAFQLLTGVLFGILLELATIQQLNAYSYGKFFLMIGGVPLSIGIGWGIIIYSVRLISDKTNLPLMVRPVLDGLLALSIDLAMDAFTFILCAQKISFKRDNPEKRTIRKSLKIRIINRPTLKFFFKENFQSWLLLRF